MGNTENKELLLPNFSLKWILIIGGIIIFALPSIFVVYNTGINFYYTGQIGDTIGGITAPFINLLGAVLVYFSFQAQLEANRKIQKQIDDQKFDGNFVYILNELNDTVNSRESLFKKEKEFKDFLTKFSQVTNSPENTANLDSKLHDLVIEIGDWTFKVVEVKWMIEESQQINLSNEHKIIITRKILKNISKIKSLIEFSRVQNNGLQILMKNLSNDNYFALQLISENYGKELESCIFRIKELENFMRESEKSA